MKISFFICLIVLFIIPARFVESATLDRALYFYEKKQFEEAFQEFDALANIGSGIAMLNVGVMYARGEYIEENFEKAYLYMYMAYLSKEPNAEKPLRVIGDRLGDIQKESIQSKAKIKLDSLSSNLVPVFKSVSEGVYESEGLELKKGMQPEYPGSMARRGKQGVVDIDFFVDAHGYTRHHFVTLLPSKYFKSAAVDSIRKTYYKPASKKGVPITVSSMSLRYVFTLDGSTEIDKEKLTEFIAESKQKADAGSSFAQAQYGRDLSAIRSVYGRQLDQQNIRLDNPNRWFLKAAQNGDASAGYSLGANLLSGNQCLTEPNKALFWLEQSVENGVMESYVLLGLELIYGYRIQQNIPKGFQLLEQAAEQGSTHAQIELARFYASHPDESLRDKKKAVKYMNMIDGDYSDKLSVYEARAAAHASADDFKQALKWQKKALKEAKKLGLPATPLESVLASFKAKKVPSYIF